MKRFVIPASMLAVWGSVEVCLAGDPGWVSRFDLTARRRHAMAYDAA